MSTYYQRPPTPDEIYHHGVKGQKWGVRRYQNYDGTYTKKGLQRYNKAVDNYEKAKKAKQIAKLEKNNGQKEKYDYKIAKSNYKIAKKQANERYDELKRANLADQGKQLYKEGYRILDVHPGDKVGAAAAVIGTGGPMVTRALSSSLTDAQQAYGVYGSIAAGTVLAGIGAGMRLSEYNKNRKLRAYYSYYG